MAQLSRIGGFQHYPRLRLLQWKDYMSNKNKFGNPKQLNLLAEMTDPRKDLINLKAVHPQMNHRRSVHMHATTPIIKKNQNLNDISNLYPSMYQQKSQ